MIRRLIRAARERADRTRLVYDNELLRLDNQRLLAERDDAWQVAALVDQRRRELQRAREDCERWHVRPFHLVTPDDPGDTAA